MKSSVFRIYGCLSLMVLLALSCQRESENSIVNDYLIDFELSGAYPVTAIKLALTTQLIAYPDLDDIIDNANYGVQVYKVHYKTHYKDSVVTASGLVCLPMGDKAFPVISFQNGTNTNHDNAPSVNPENSLYMMMEYMASNGYVVLMTDYIGFGSTSAILHPYYHKVSTNNAVIDLIHAFNEMSETDAILASDNNTLYLMGYSQGGWATMSALYAIEQEDALDMNVIAASCGAGAYNLMSVTNYILDLETFPGPLYLPYFIYSHMDYGALSSSLGTFFKEPYVSRIPGLFDGTQTNDEVNEGLTDTIADLLTTNMLENFNSGPEFNELRQELIANSISGWNTAIPLNIYHGTSDTNVPPQQSLSIYNEFIDSGSSPNSVTHSPLDGLTHETGLLPWGISTINWFNSLETNK